MRRCADVNVMLAIERDVAPRDASRALPGQIRRGRINVGEAHIRGSDHDLEGLVLALRGIKAHLATCAGGRVRRDAFQTGYHPYVRRRNAGLSGQNQHHGHKHA